ncbi:predicted protein [Postia placenta Mad-698-R]|uniref:Uncharacterized protein n=1 Tax=Postia placenta MAD-698-R-SB12 TaxID=670580 RepID=A0A1X6MRJ5_9APHY|nr:hypothetical protein POSPLADRAFT_1152155 [Postia placenta MAD-698-R-SB12]EED82183.1 predicted protein [Postia placenta Mad-698-R]OSX58919.1 hypothetical protein POSPLADRAFT_1152155 [Postia placenta MAD-698-R-SB12]
MESSDSDTFQRPSSLLSSVDHVELNIQPASSSKDRESLQSPKQERSLRVATRATGSLSLVLCCVFLIPYAVFAVALWGLALIEYFICLSRRGRTLNYNDMTLVKTERDVRSYIWKNISRGTDNPTRRFCGGVAYILLPSLRIQDSVKHRDYVAKSEKMAKVIEDEIKGCRHLLDALEKELVDMKYIAITQATADHTGYHGLADWAQKTLENHKDLIEALYQVSFVGAGLTYSTIFSATRGNIGLMCYAFALFNCGFTIPMVSIALLKWAASRPREALFASPKIWSALLNVFLYVSGTAIAVAICLLNVTIVFLQFREDSDGVRTDSPAQFNVAPRPAGIFALVCITIPSIMTLLALALHYCANGWDTLFSALIGNYKQESGQGFDNYILR